MVEIDKENLFFAKLRSGINVFAGAGFSALPSPSGKVLPTASSLCQDLCDEFKIEGKFAHDLEKVSAIIKMDNKSGFYEYLRRVFTVEDYSPLYDNLDKVNIKSFITTNIDNMFPLVMDSSRRHYLNYCTYGAAKHNGAQIEYIPLHGFVGDVASEFYFGGSELCSVDRANLALFDAAKTDMARYPTFFWGYGFHDGSVLRILDEVLTARVRGGQSRDIWIQCCQGDENIGFLRRLGYNVVIGTTEEILKVIGARLGDGADPKAGMASGGIWREHAVPTIANVASATAESYYAQGNTQWYSVLVDVPYLTEFASEVMDASYVEKNIVLVGMPFCGKTTLLMQLAKNSDERAFYFDRPREEQVKLLMRNLAPDEGALVFVDNCAEDMKAYAMLARQPNLRTVAASDEYLFEQARHFLEGVAYRRMNFGDIEEAEARRIFSFIPENCRNDEFRYRDGKLEKYQMLELISYNVRNVISRDRVADTLMRIRSDDGMSLQIVLLTAYLSKNKSALSTDVMFYYLGEGVTYEAITGCIEKVNGYLSDLDIDIYPDAVDQDYYALRSALFAKYATDIAIKDFKPEYGEVVKRVVESIPYTCIYNYRVFARTGFDSGFFYELFGANADELYETIFAYDPSGYVLQQQALYKSACGKYSEAFADIDRASDMLPLNFSIKNAKAIIQFEANKDKSSDGAIDSLHNAMRTLASCYRSDRRKLYHAQRYAEFAMYLDSHLDDGRYLRQAREWLTALMEKDGSASRKTRRLLAELTGRLECHERDLRG